MSKKIEDAVVGTYRKIEDSVVGTYKNIENKFVDKYLIQDKESTHDAKVRIKKEQEEMKQKNQDLLKNNTEKSINR